MSFEFLEQRMAKTYLDMLPPFIPDYNSKVNSSNQELFYNIIKSIYELAFYEPLLFVSSLNPDDAYPKRFNKSSYGKPELQKNMKKMITAVDSLIENMYLAGKGEEVKLNQRQQIILSRVGVKNLSILPKAWKWMSTRPAASLISFKYCLFDEDYPYTSDIYAKLLGEKPFRRLERWLSDNNYSRFDFYDLIGSDCKLSLSYLNLSWSQKPPRGGFEYKIEHSGISARYDAFIENPQVLGICIPGGLKPYLLAFSDMDAKTKDFVLAHAKRCNGCRYCVQTDKTGSRPLAAIGVIYNKRMYNLCPYFPGANFCFTGIDEELVDRIIGMLSFIDKHAKKSIHQ